MATIIGAIVAGAVMGIIGAVAKAVYDYYTR